jgi:hypothetical protein
MLPSDGKASSVTCMRANFLFVLYLFIRTASYQEAVQERGEAEYIAYFQQHKSRSELDT